MALFIISPYIGEGERKVLLALSKVFHIAYCDFFDPTEANAWQQIYIDFVHSVRTFMPKQLHKQKVRYLLHLVERMKNYGPSSAFSAELNKQAPSRDIANHFAIVEHLHYICNGCYYDSNERCSKGLQDLYSSDQVQSFLNLVPSKVLKANRDIYKPGTARMATSYSLPSI
ncbi:hypothetical protein EMCRGX_G023196 [Ephydatia muelleri]